MLCFAILFLTTVNVSAYKTVGYKWSSKSVKYMLIDTTYLTNAKVAAAATSWNSTNVTVSDATGNIVVSTTSNPNVTWDGLTNLNYSGSYFTSASVYLNRAMPAFSNTNALKSVMTHEFGHVLGLGENGATQTIMNQYTYGSNSRYGAYGLTVPQTDDKNGVNSIYK